MNPNTLTARSNPAHALGTPFLQPGALTAAPAAARWLCQLLKNLEVGALEIHWPDGRCSRYGKWTEQGAVQPSPAVLQMHDWAVCADVLKRGDIGLAQAYIDGRWQTPDLLALMNTLVANRDALTQAVYGRWWGSALERVRHWLNRNTKRGSRRNIQAHYDLGNDFYRLWLDPTMNYSSAWFDGKHDQDMPQAQCAKVRRALTQSQLPQGGRVLEIGCGWGALAEMAARDWDAHVVGVTLSSEQLAWGQARLSSQALTGDLRLQDYRDIQDAPFDAVVSIEMFEAVGRQYWDTYFSNVQRLLKRGGRACIQSITIRDDLFERYAGSTDFIQQYIFPGGMLPSRVEFRAAAARAGLVVVDEMAFGQDYAETLRRWRVAFLARQDAVRALGFDEPFMRTWEFYLVYCQAAFAGGNTDVVQFTLAHQG